MTLLASEERAAFDSFVQVTNPSEFGSAFFVRTNVIKTGHHA